jgi:hypothetical protein
MHLAATTPWVTFSASLKNEQKGSYHKIQVQSPLKSQGDTHMNMPRPVIQKMIKALRDWMGMISIKELTSNLELQCALEDLAKDLNKISAKLSGGEEHYA